MKEGKTKKKAAEKAGAAVAVSPPPPAPEPPAPQPPPRPSLGLMGARRRPSNGVNAPLVGANAPPGPPPLPSSSITITEEEADEAGAKEPRASGVYRPATRPPPAFPSTNGRVGTRAFDDDEDDFHSYAEARFPNKAAYDADKSKKTQQEQDAPAQAVAK